MAWDHGLSRTGRPRGSRGARAQRVHRLRRCSNTVRRRVRRLLLVAAWSLGTTPADRRDADSPLLAEIVSAAAQGRVPLDPRAGARVWCLGQETDVDATRSRDPCQAHLDGFDPPIVRIEPEEWP